MTDQQADLRFREAGYDADAYDDVGYDQAGYEAGYDDADGDIMFEDAFDEWDDYVPAPRPSAPTPTPRPWYRDPRWLFGLIALAAAALVVATVLLVTGRGSGEIPTSPELSTRTAVSTTSTPTPRSARPSASPSATTTPTSAASTSEEPVDIAPPPPPIASAVEAPPEAPEASQNRNSDGPRINVTRTPMSFSPGKH